MNKKLETKLAKLPTSPGVYFYKDAQGEIIYIGKAANLRNRVRQYFQNGRPQDTKTQLLVNDIVDLDFMVVDSEIDALFLEGEQIRRYMPRYNILLRDDKSMVYVRIDHDSNYPTVSLTRRPLDDGAKYFGPYLSAFSIRQALKMLRRIFPYAVKKPVGQKRANLHYHLGLDPGLEEGKTSLKDYRANLRKLMLVIEGKRKSIEKELKKEMDKCAQSQDYEGAAKKRNQLLALQRMGKQVIFSSKEFLDISKDHALAELVELLGLKKFPKRIEGYDISHMSGTNVVASMVVFSNGVSDKREYRKFKTYQNRNDDFANMKETLSRRFKDANVKKWGLPDLVLIDGGKGQLEAATRARDENTSTNIPFIGLAKREEQIIIQNDKSGVTINEKTLQKLNGFLTGSGKFTQINLPKHTNMVKLLQRIRDESHRFAVSYHSTLKTKQQTASVLEEIPGIGPATRKKLIRAFGSARAVSSAKKSELAQVIGSKKAKMLHSHLSGPKFRV